jgi:hydrogenase maturation protease
MSTLVIGVGNPGRGDDALGLEVTRRVRDRRLAGVRVVECAGRADELMEVWRGAEHVVLVDAASGEEPGRVRRFDARAGPLPASLRHASTHSWGVAEAIELARALGELPARVVVYGVFGRAFAAGHGRLSREAEGALPQACDAVLEELGVAATPCAGSTRCSA